MLNEPHNIDFYTSGQQLSDEDFRSISQWIAADKRQRPDIREVRSDERIRIVRYIRTGRVVRRVRQAY